MAELDRGDQEKKRKSKGKRTIKPESKFLSENGYEIQTLNASKLITYIRKQKLKT